MSIDNNQASIDVLGTRQNVSTIMVPEVKIGDYVLTSAGLIVEILEEDDAMASIAIFQELMALGADDGQNGNVEL